MKKSKRFLSILLSILMLPTAMAPISGMTASAADTAIVDMKVEDLRDPIGIDAENPVFSWKMQSDVIGQAQTAYRIEVATDGAFTGKVWDSGKVAEDTSVGIAYAGEALKGSTKYYWRVTVWDKDGNGSHS